MFHNRLAKGMRLQSDPTIILWDVATIGRNAHQYSQGRHLRANRLQHLHDCGSTTVGPIATLGEMQLAAAMRPEKSPYLYFVSRNDGTHVFTSTYEDHQKAVKQFQLDRKARENKSWRDLTSRRRSLKSLSSGISAFGAKCWYRVAR